MQQEVEDEVSLFGYYVRAANVAASMGIGLGYAFDRYIKPTMPTGEMIKTYTRQEYAEIFGSRDAVVGEVK